MSYRGRVKDGSIEFDPPAKLADGTVVEVVVVSEAAGKEPAVPTLAERYGSIVGILEGLPPELASAHEHPGAAAARPADE